MATQHSFSDCPSTRLHRLTRLVDDTYRKHLQAVGISESQMSILLTLADQGSLLQSELGKALHLQRSTVTRNLDRLVKNGYLEKKGSPARPEISLTRRGKNYSKKVREAWNAAMQDLTQALGSSGFAALGVLERRLLEPGKMV